MKKFKNIYLFLLFTIILTIISSFISELSMDGIWNFGFSYNIANGTIPYKDFNMVIGPFYNLIIAGFLKLFGNYVIVFQIVNSVIISLFMIPIYHKIKKNAIYLVLFLGILPIIYGYNTFCAFLLIGVILLEDSKLKYKNILIGLLIGIIIMTKHNIGLVILMVSFILNKDKLKLVIGVVIPIVSIVCYLICNNALLAYIDFCYLGLGNFMDNFYFEWPIIISVLLIFILLLKRYLLTKDKKLLYLIAFQIVNFPLFDFNHFMISSIPLIYYLFLTIKRKDYNNILKLFIFGIFLILSIIRILEFNLTDIDFLKYNRVPSDVDDYLHGMEDYITNKRETNNVYLFLSRSYIIKIYLNEKITFTDLINQGNLGKNEYKYIEDIDSKCKKNKCLFILDEEFFNGGMDIQMNPIFKDYVLKNGYYLEKLPSGDSVYVNYEMNPES